MSMTNAEIAGAFEQLADLLEIEDANPFRVRAYRNAAQTVQGLSRPVADLVKEGADLTEIYGIGDDLAHKLHDMVETGRLEALDKARKRVPAALSELMAIEQLGPKRVKALYKALDVQSVDDLEQAVRQGRVRALPGFGAKTEERILQGLASLRERHGRTPLRAAEEAVVPLVRHLGRVEGVDQVTVAGSFRRRRETVGDLDILVSCEESGPVMEAFVGFPDIARVASRGTTRSTAYLTSGLQVDLRVLPGESYGAALQYFTGSKAHNVALRGIAHDHGLKLNEYGLFRGEDIVAGRTETDVYEALGLSFIEPELREGRGEIEAARRGELPRLLELSDIRGDLHLHTTATDGRDSLEDMVAAAQELGYEYIAITDHSRRVTMARGLDEERLERHIQAIDRINESIADLTVLKGIEVDILKDGSLDLPDRALSRLDVCVCAVHYHRELDRDTQTERILRAMASPFCHILAHPAGRLVQRRDPMDVDMEAVVAAAADYGVMLELNAQPARLDLMEQYRRMAKDYGVQVAVSTDAHAAEHLQLMRYGVEQGRRGWLEAADVANTRSLDGFLELVAYHQHCCA